MAFKILNDEEISLLTDEQVECYQKEPEINRYYQGNRVCTFHKSRAAKAQSETYAKA